MSGMKVFMKIADMPGSSLERADWSEVRGFSHEMKYPFDMREAKGRGEPEHVRPRRVGLGTARPTGPRRSRLEVR